MPARLTHPDQLKELLGIPFTPEQTACITAPPAPQVIVAGAGSGKTTVMAARVVWLVGTGQVAPEQVLGLTFTNKAAGELAERVRTALIKAGITDPETLDPENPPGEPVISTYHAFAGRLLTDHGLRIGIEPTVRLLADATRFQLAARTLREAPGPYPSLTRSFADLVSDLLALDSELAEHLVQPHTLRAYDQELLRSLESAKLSNAELRKVPEAAAARLELAELVGRYREAKRAKDVLDFGDQIALSATLADTRPEVGAILRDEFRVVLLDEYQDTSVAQRILLSGLFGAGTGHPVTAVGDPCQAIYGWRGASVANLDDFPEHFAYADGRPANRFALSENRRSGGRLLDLAHTLAEPLRALHARVEALRPAPRAERDGVVRIALTETHAEELEWLADSIAHLVRTGKEPADIAVLCRTAGDFAEIQGALVARDIPVEVVGLSGLLHLPEVADLVAVCEVLQDPGANASLVRLLTGPRWRIGPRDLALLGRRARMLVYREQDPEGDADARLAQAVEGTDPAEVISLADALDTFLEAEPAGTDLPFSPDARVRFARLATELRELRRSLADPLMDVLHRVLAVTGLDVELSASPHALAARRRETLSNFLDIAASFASNDPSASLLAFLAFLRTAAQYEKGLDNALPGGENTVKVLTAHKSKGLEWDVVVVPGLVTGTFPSGQGREKWTAQAKVLPHALRGDAATLPEVGGWDSRGLKAFQEDMKDHQRTEELRLGYVTFTRPRSLLLGSGHWWGPTQKKKRGPSDFLTALYEHCAAGHGEIELWAEEPEDEAENPALAEASAEHAWPLPLDDASLGRRRAAAATVLAHLDALRTARAHGHDETHPSAYGDVPSDEAHEDAYDPEWPPEPEDFEEPEGPYPQEEELPHDWENLPHQRPEDPGSDGRGSDGPDTRRSHAPAPRDSAPAPAPRDSALAPAPSGSAAPRPQERDPHPTPVPRARTPRTPEDLRTVASWDRDLEALATELRRSRRASHDVPLPASLSASQVLRLSTDPDGLARELARPMPRPPAPGGPRGPPGPPRGRARFEALELPLLDPDELPGGDAEIADEHDLAALKDAFERTPYAHRTPYAIEAPFQLAIAGRVIRGRIDAVYRTQTADGITYEIVDWKTGHGGTADPLQLAIYRLAWSEQHEVPLETVTAAFVFVRTGKVTIPERLPTREQLEELLNPRSNISPSGD
ncbi:ATP-dependent DNA helicase [Streptomyces sp. N35]|uniref:ATP-dependent DNA helicase n=1 Tax=Streptomyces sp. N35 TaxID=2795730 RepID=UPI0018F45208|nr:ATP-dependent DNA helicase [Streptomyces sp. N35]